MAAVLALGTAWAVAPQLTGGKLTEKPMAAEGRIAKSAMQPVQQEAQPVEVRMVSEADIEDLNLQPIVKEDFSLMTQGSETEPYLYSHGYIYIPDEVTHTPGWTGAGIAEAGGKLMLANPGHNGIQGGGCINTPLGDYSGHIIVKYRIKAVSADGVTFCNVCKGGIEYPEAAVDGMFSETFKDKEWHEYIVDVKNPHADEDGFIQINALTFNGDGFLVDKVEVYRDMDYVYAPNTLTATNFKADSFTASWNKVTTAKDYLVTLFEDTPLSKDNFSATEDFEKITAGGNLDAKDIPEGWDIHLVGPKQTTADHGQGNSKAIVLSDANDYLQLPYNGGTFMEVSAFMRNLSSDKNQRPGYLYIDVRDPGTGAWKQFATMNANVISDIDGYTFSTKDIEAQYGAAYPFSTMYDAVRFRTSGCEGGGLAFDNITYTTTPPAKRVTLKDKMPVNGNSVTFTDLDPEAEHYFTVAARNGETVSETSLIKHAFGISEITGFKVSDVDPRGGLTAEWDRVPRADRYEVGSFEATVIDADTKDYKVLEEDFSGVTVRNPVTDPLFIGNENALTSLDEYTSTPGWTGRGTILAKGMLGCLEDPYAVFEIFTPYITLSNNGGKYNVYIKLYAEKGTQVVVQNTDTYQVMTFPDTGTYEATIPMESGKDQDRFMFYTVEGQMFLIDELRVTQDVKAGDLLYSRLEEIETTDCSHRFTYDPQEGKLYAVQVQAFQTLFKKTCSSPLTPMLAVDFFDDAVEGVEGENATLNVRGLEGALKLTAAKAVNVAVADMNGRLRFVGTVDGEKTVELPAGIYVVTSGNKAYKLVVR